MGERRFGPLSLEITCRHGRRMRTQTSPTYVEWICPDCGKFLFVDRKRAELDEILAPYHRAPATH